MSDPGTEPSAAQLPIQPSSGAPAGADATSAEMLLLGARMRDASALGSLFDRYGGLVYTLALRIMGNRDLAEDVTQDVFLRCWHGFEQHDAAQGTVAVWLLGVTRGRALSLLRSRQSQGIAREDEPATSVGARDPSTVDQVSEGETRAAAPGDEDGVGAQVREALAELSGPQRAAIEAAYYGGLTQSEVADRLGEPLGRVKMRIRDGLRRLRRVLASDVEDSPTRERGVL
jgi:RNA polymerase sigma-70 factor (ECF subfamily)